MRRLGFLYLFSLLIALSGVMPPAVSDSILMVVLGTAPMAIMFYLLEPPKKRDKCPPHNWPEDGTLVCKDCGYRPRS